MTDPLQPNALQDSPVSGVSVILCCHNSSRRLPKTLKYLAAQQTPPHLSWEVVLVDNASTDDTSAVALRIWNEHENSVPLKIVTEPIPGLSSARSTGILHSTYEYVIFCDDDNWLNPDYVVKVFDRARIGSSDRCARRQKHCDLGRSIARLV